MFEVERNAWAWPWRWAWRRVDASGQPVPDPDGVVRTHAGYPFKWLATLAAKRATR